MNLCLSYPRPFSTFLRGVLLWLTLSCAAFAQTTATIAGKPSTSTTTPNGRAFQPGLWLAEQYKKVEEMKGACDLIFLGDSITFNWSGTGGGLWKKYYASRRGLIYGIPGDNIQGLLFRLDHAGLSAINPKVAVVLIGTNNGGPAVETAAGIKAVIEKIQAVFPGVKIILLDILPTARRTEHITAANEVIRTFADNVNVFRLNLHERMIRDGDTWKGLGPDKLHLSAEGYQIWAEMMEPLLIKLMGPVPATAR